MPFRHDLSVTKQSLASSMGSETTDPYLVLGLLLRLYNAGLVLRSVTGHQLGARRRKLGITGLLGDQHFHPGKLPIGQRHRDGPMGILLSPLPFFSAQSLPHSSIPTSQLSGSTAHLLFPC